MRLGAPADLKDEAAMRGTFGSLTLDPLQGEGTESEIRAARQAHLREQRIAAARKKWPEIRELERRGRFVVDLRDGKVFEPLRVQVWPSGDPRGTINEHEVAAFAIENGDVVFFKSNTIGAQSVAELEQWQEDRAHLANRRREKAELEAETAERALAEFRKAQRPSAVTLADVEGRELPSVRQAVEKILAAGGKLDVKDGRLVVQLPEQLAPNQSAHEQAKAELMDCVKVLIAGGELVTEAVASRSKKTLVERLPDVQVLAGGGLTA